MVDMAVQSMNEQVLKNIKRSNISLDDYIDINKKLQDDGRSTRAELIMLLPGETKKISHTLEYGDSQMEVQVGSGKVLIFDDVLATGGTSQAAVDVLTKAGYTPVAALFPVELTFLNPTLSIPYESVIKY